ncbi:MAG: hypothetical protein ACRCTQ_02960 [Brevinemataceae bacterium]
MKFLLLFLCLFNSCVDKSTPKLVTEISHHQATNQLAGKESEMTSEEITTIISGLENGDYTVLDPFFETNQLFPVSRIRNGFTVDYYGTDADNILYEKTNYIQFPNVGEIITYTNQYGIPFVESHKLLIPIETLTNLRKDTCYGTEYFITSINNATNRNAILTIDSCISMGSSYQGQIIFGIKNAIFNYLEKYIDNNSIKKISNIFDQNYNSWKNFIINKVSSDDLETMKKQVLNTYIDIMLIDYNLNNEIYPIIYQENEVCYIKITNQ